MENWFINDEIKCSSFIKITTREKGTHTNPQTENTDSRGVGHFVYLT